MVCQHSILGLVERVAPNLWTDGQQSGRLSNGGEPAESQTLQTKRAFFKAHSNSSELSVVLKNERNEASFVKGARTTADFFLSLWKKQELSHIVVSYQHTSDAYTRRGTLTLSVKGISPSICVQNEQSFRDRWVWFIYLLFLDAF